MRSVTESRPILADSFQQQERVVTVKIVYRRMLISMILLRTPKSGSISSSMSQVSSQEPCIVDIYDRFLLNFIS